MTAKDINQVLASNIAAEMSKRGLSQTQLSKLSGIAQTTISLYLRPGSRKAGKSGKPPPITARRERAFLRLCSRDKHHQQQFLAC